ncbi:MAG: hypothetical protein AAF661_11630 [Pseudomonadota bacterium]
MIDEYFRPKRWKAGFVMGCAAAAAAFITLEWMGAPGQDRAMIIPAYAFSTMLVGALIMHWFAAQPKFGYPIAIFGGVLTVALAFIPFSLIMLGLTQWEVLGGDLQARASPTDIALGVMVIGPIFAAPALLPFGVIGGTLCRTMTLK